VLADRPVAIFRVVEAIALDRGALHLLRDRHQLGARLLEGELHAAGPLGPIHPDEGLADRAPHRQQAVVAQEQHVVLAEIARDRLALAEVGGDALVGVVGGAGDHRQRVLRDRQQPALLRRHADARLRMRVHAAGDIRPRHVHGAMDDEAGRIDLVVRVADDVAVDIHLDQARGGDLLEHEAIGIDEEVVAGTRHAGRKMRADQVRPAEQVHQPVGRRQVDAPLPLGGRHARLGCAARFARRCRGHCGLPYLRE
jgi:hypothetical protein